MGLLAFWSGDWRARSIASFQLALLGFGYFNHYHFCNAGRCWGSAASLFYTWRWLIEDPIELAVCFACALRAERYWVLWATSIAVLITANDAAQVFVPGVTAWAAVSANLVFYLAMNVAVLVGVWPSVRARMPWPAPRFS